MNVEVNRSPEYRIPAGVPLFDANSTDSVKNKLIVVNHPDETCQEFHVDNIGIVVNGELTD